MLHMEGTISTIPHNSGWDQGCNWGWYTHLLMFILIIVVLMLNCVYYSSDYLMSACIVTIAELVCLLPWNTLLGHIYVWLHGNNAEWFVIAAAAISALENIFYLICLGWIFWWGVPSWLRSWLCTKMYFSSSCRRRISSLAITLGHWLGGRPRRPLRWRQTKEGQWSLGTIPLWI